MNVPALQPPISLAGELGWNGFSFSLFDAEVSRLGGSGLLATYGLPSK